MRTLSVKRADMVLHISADLYARCAGFLSPHGRERIISAVAVCAGHHCLTGHVPWVNIMGRCEKQSIGSNMTVVRFWQHRWAVYWLRKDAGSSTLLHMMW